MMEVKMAKVDCAYCGFVFSVPCFFDKRMRDDHKSFYCPACKGSLVYSDETDAEKCVAENVSLKRQLKRSQTDATLSERRRISQKGATTKLRNRLSELEEANSD